MQVLPNVVIESTTPSASSPPGNPIDVGIAIQGGGARLRSLLVALRVFQQAEVAGTLRVTKLVGTSAGAIAAVLYAARVPMERVLSWMDDQKSWKSVLPPERPKGLSARILHTLFCYLLLNARQRRTVRQYGICIGNALRGYPLFTLDPFISSLSTIIERESMLPSISRLTIDKATVGDFTKATGMDRLTLVKTNMEKRSAEPAAANELLLKAIVNSIALPVALRHVKSSETALHLDGGICANLPADLLDGTSRIAIGFKQHQATIPGDTATLAIDILSTAIDSAVDRQMAGIGLENVCALPTEYDTFDFPLLFGDAHHYDDIVPATYSKNRKHRDRDNVTDVATDFLETWVQRSQATRDLAGDSWSLALNEGGGAAANQLKARMEELAKLAKNSQVPIESYSYSYELFEKKNARGTPRVGAIVSEERLMRLDAWPINGPALARMGFIIPKDSVILPGFAVKAMVANEEARAVPWTPALDLKNYPHPNGFHRLLLVNLEEYAGQEAVKVSLQYTAEGMIQYLDELFGEEFGVSFRDNGSISTNVNICIRVPTKLGRFELQQTRAAECKQNDGKDFVEYDVKRSDIPISDKEFIFHLKRTRRYAP